MLNVPIDVIIANGAVSKATAIAMCEGALRMAPVQLTVSVTGIAGPNGGSNEKPVGTVHIASAREGRGTIEKRYLFNGNREDIRIATITRAIEMLLSQV